MIKFNHRGDFSNITSFLKKKRSYKSILDKYGQIGVIELFKATPKDSGFTADSWKYTTEISNTGLKVIWTNSNLVNGIPVAILIQYGHGTRSGSFVQGRDFINPAMKPIFDKMAEDIWKEVNTL